MSNGDDSLKAISSAYLDCLRAIREESGIPILTQSAEQHLIQISQLDQVEMYGTPGAGGDDAYFILYSGDQDKMAEKVESLSPDLTFLPVGHDSQGLRTEWIDE